MSKPSTALEKLRRLGLTPYEAWLCVEHSECPENLDPLEAFKALEEYLRAAAEQGLPDPEEEWWQRYRREIEAKKQKLTIPA